MGRYLMVILMILSISAVEARRKTDCMCESDDGRQLTKRQMRIERAAERRHCRRKYAMYDVGADGLAAGRWGLGVQPYILGATDTASLGTFFPAGVGMYRGGWGW